MPRLATLSALLVLAACAESEPPDVSPAEDGGAYNMIDPVTAEVAENAGPAIGEWTRTMQEERPALAFGPAGAEPLFSMRCDDREGILLNRHGVVEAGTTGMMTLVLGANPHRLAVNPVEGPLPMLRAAVPANDPLIAALRAHRGPLELVGGDGPSLVLPPRPAVEEILGECASGDVSPFAAPDTGTENVANAVASHDGTP